MSRNESSHIKTMIVLLLVVSAVLSWHIWTTYGALIGSAYAFTQFQIWLLASGIGRVFNLTKFNGNAVAQIERSVRQLHARLS